MVSGPQYRKILDQLLAEQERAPTAQDFTGYTPSSIRGGAVELADQDYRAGQPDGH